MINQITKYKFQITLIIVALIGFLHLKSEIPTDLPLPIIEKIDKPSPEAIFLSPFGPSAQQGGEYKNYFIIFDSTLNVVSYKLVPGTENGYIGYHFKTEPNGYLSFLTRKLDGTISLADTNYNIIKSYKDTFSLFNRIKYYAHYDLLPNGNTQIVLYNFQYLDMSKYFPQGEPNGAVLQAIIQELDKNDNVVFQWKSLDYVPVNKTQNAVAPNIDYFHPNSMMMDLDGNLLLSARDLCSIIKINRNTGDIMWNLGGKDNNFKFIDEDENNAPNYFSYQHDIRVLPNGNITIFDNGRQHNPQYSRAVEYELNQDAKTCKKVWEYRHDPEIFADQHGSAQRLANGNTLIAWGTYSMDGYSAVTEVKPDNSIALEFKFPTGLESQFIYKYPWPVCQVKASIEKRECLELNTYKFNSPGNYSGVEVKFNKLDAFVYNKFEVKKYDCSPLNPNFEGRPPIIYPYRFTFTGYDFSSLECEIHLSLDFYPLVVNKEKIKLFYRPKEAEGIFLPLETVYDSATNSLIAVTNYTGEFIIGFKDIAIITDQPFTYNPQNGSKPNGSKPIKFDWSPKGYFLNSRIQVAKDTNFTEIVIDSTLRKIDINTSILKNGSKYFWRVNSSNEAGTSEWSKINSFTLSDPYISLQVPNGGEIWDTTSHIIRWDFNLKDSVDQFFKIELLRNGDVVSLIQPQRFSAVNAYKWKIPGTTPTDSTYQIRVTSIKNPEITSISNGYFKIINHETRVNEIFTNQINIYNFPNPVLNTTSFEMSTDIYGFVKIILFDILGNELETIYSDYLVPGNYNFQWNSNKYENGIYLYKFSVNDYSLVKKMLIIK